MDVFVKKQEVHQVHQIPTLHPYQLLSGKNQNPLHYI